MPEQYPDDSALLALESDPHTGVEYIPTGQSPYYLEFRKLMQRTQLAAARASDLRVYADGDLSFGVRPGRCLIAGQPLTFDGAESVVLANNQTTSIWLDGAATLQTSTAGFPTDRTSFVPLAEANTAAGVIADLVDRRGEAMLLIPDLTQLGVAASAAEVNQALTGINPTVDAAALNALTGGASSDADSEHRHTQMVTDADAPTFFRLINTNGGISANVALVFDLPAVLPDVTTLLPDSTSGQLRQQFLGSSWALVGATHVTFNHAGDLTASVNASLAGVVPIAGTVVGVILSVGQNIVSSDSADGLAATAFVNGTALVTTPASITDDDGTGFRCTDQGDGTPAVIKSDGVEQVSRGDVITIDLLRTANGTITTEAADISVLIVVRADAAE